MPNEQKTAFDEWVTEYFRPHGGVDTEAEGTINMLRAAWNAALERATHEIAPLRLGEGTPAIDGTIEHWEITKGVRNWMVDTATQRILALSDPAPE